MRPLLPLLSLLALAWGCGEGKEPVDSGGPGDSTPDCIPADEIPYDGIDQDCDGEDLTDVDGDGQDSTEVGGRDCDDTDPEVHAGNAEECNGIDDDCDGLIDADDTYNLVGGETAYHDADGDGYGDPDTEAVFCEVPSGWIASSDDCDDGDAAVYPGAKEICDDGLDNDCRGWDAECREPQVIGATLEYLGTSRGESAGDWVSHGGDIDGDGFDDVVINAPGGGAVDGIAYVVFGGAVSTASTSGPIALDGAGVAIGDGGDMGFSAGVGDVDGDGLGDVLVSAAELKEVYLFSGASLATMAGQVPPDLADAVLTNTQRFAMVAGAGDTNGDGVGDLLIQSAGHSNNWDYSTGGAFVFLGPVTGDLVLEDAAPQLYGDSLYGSCGRYLDGAGDTNGDGLDDVVILDVESANMTGWSGEAYLVLGPVTADRELVDADAIIGHEGSIIQPDYVEWCVAHADDTDGDGYDDLLIGSAAMVSGEVRGGGVVLLRGPFESEVLMDDADAKLFGDGGRAGTSVASAGDLNDDGFPDIVVGDLAADPGEDDAGVVYVVLGPISGSHGLADADFEFDGQNHDDWAGYSASAGDFDGDGRVDLIVGAPGNDDADSNAGAAYLILNTELYP